MLISKEITIKLHGKKIKHFLELGYEFPMHNTKDGPCIKEGTVASVRVQDLPMNSHEMVLISCDYCGKEYWTRYDGYVKRKQNDIGKDCCKQCKSVKNKELNLLRYNVENQFQREEVKEKSRSTLLEKYGCEHPMKSDEIRIRAMRSMADNNGVATSRQQRYLHKLIGGLLNYTDESTCMFQLDIAFPEEKIYVEYDGSGHDLQVKFGNITREEFIKKEQCRYEMLNNNGWKLIKFISSKDYLPSDEVIINEIGRAKLTLLKRSFYIIRIEKSNDKYGKLRSIKDANLLVNVGDN